jgi:hypothetical protein
MITSPCEAGFRGAGRGRGGDWDHAGKSDAVSKAVAATRTRVFRGFMIFLGSP